MTTYREVVCTQHLTVSIHDVTGRHHRLVLGISDDLLGQASCLIGLGTVGSTLLHIIELQRTGILTHDDRVERIPLGNLGTSLHDLTLLVVERRTVRHVHGGEDDIRIGVNKLDLGKTTHNHLALHVVAVLVFLSERNGTQLVELDARLVLGNDAGVGGSVTSHTTGVEGTERQLSTRLTNSLSGNHTDSLTQLHHTGSSQVAAVTLHADTLLALAGKHGTNLDALDGRILDRLGLRLSNLLAGRNDQLTRSRMDDIVYRHTTQDTLIERRDDLVTVLQGGAYQATQGTAVALGDDHVVGNVHKTTSQVTGVGSLHSGIGKTLTGTV